MSCSVRALTIGSLECSRDKLVVTEDQSSRHVFASNAFLITHRPSGRHVLFDLGCKKDNLPRQRARYMAMHRDFNVKVDQSAAQVLRRETSLEPKDIHAVIYSHLHFDHTGSHEEFPDSALWAGHGSLGLDLHSKDSPFDEIPRLQEFSFDAPRLADFDAHDFFKDGALRLLSTPGHLPGHVVALVKLADSRAIILGGDLAHTMAAIRGEEAENMAMHRDQARARIDVDKVVKLMQAENANLYLAHENGIHGELH